MKILKSLHKIYPYLLSVILVLMFSIIMWFLFIVMYMYTGWKLFLFCSILIPFLIIFSPLYKKIINLSLNYFAYILLFSVLLPFFYFASKLIYNLYLLQNSFDPYVSFYMNFCDIYIKSDYKSKLINCIHYFQEEIPAYMLTDKILKNGNGPLIPSGTYMYYLISYYKQPDDLQIFANFITCLITYNVGYFEDCLTDPVALQEIYYTYLPLVCKALGLQSILEGNWTLI